jgi:hypothetical protein
MPLRVEPSEYHTHSNGAGQEGTSPNNGTWDFIFFVQSEHNSVSPLDFIQTQRQTHVRVDREIQFQMPGLSLSLLAGLIGAADIP